MFDRRSFLALATAATAARADEPSNPSVPNPFADPDFGFADLVALGASYYGGGNPGKLLEIVGRIQAGDIESGYQAFHDAAEEARKLAEQAGAEHRRVSAREAYLWAAGYFSIAMRFLDGTKDPDRILPCWQEYAACWTAAAARFDPPIEHIEIPYEGGHLTGWFLRADHSRRRRPLVILNNGADGMENSSFVLGGAGALARGYNCLIFNGPGQGDALWARKLYFRPDWEKVITPVVDVMLRHREVEPRRIALIGISMGGYWVPRALAFEHRIVAGVADPGAWDLSTPWLQNLPKFVRDALDAGKKDQFDQMLRMGTANNVRIQAMLRFRMRPYGTASYYEAFHGVQAYHLKDVAGRIRCPMLITDSEGEQFFPGQARTLYDALECPKSMVRFTRAQGAAQHCEVAAPGYRDYCIYNWLDQTLG